MRNNNIDHELKQALMDETDSTEHLQEETWQHIQQTLFPKRAVKRRKKKSFLVLAAMVVLISVAWAGLSTTKGQAIIQEIKDMFVSEKDVDLDIEGQKEQTHVELEANEELSYVIYVDTSRYKTVETETGDIISPNPPLEDRYPEVSMEIIREEGVTEEEAISRIKEDIAQLKMILRQEEKVSSPLEATVIRAIGSGENPEEPGGEWDTPIYKYYVTEEQQGQIFIIKQKYFLEAAEGHGVRFDGMLETFETIPKSNKTEE